MVWAALRPFCKTGRTIRRKEGKKDRWIDFCDETERASPEQAYQIRSSRLNSPVLVLDNGGDEIDE